MDNVIYSKPLFRTLEVRKENIDVDERTVSLSFSSENPVSRFWGYEILGHEKGEVRMQRLNNAAPLLLYHDRREQVGVIDKATINRELKKGHAVVRFSKSTKAEEIFQDVIDGIRKTVSVAYRVYEMILEKVVDGVEHFRVTDWEPVEISLEPTPADISVGVGRELGEENKIKIIRGEEMPKEDVKEPDVNQDKRNSEITITHKVETRKEDKPPKPKDEKTVEERTVVSQEMIDAEFEKEMKRQEVIRVIAEKHNVKDMGEKFIRERKPVEDFRVAVLEEVYRAKPVETDPKLGLSDKEAKGFSLFRAVNAACEGDWSDAGFEREVSRAWEKKIGRKPRNFFIPPDILNQRDIEIHSAGLSERAKQHLQQRDLVVGTATAGGNLVATELLSASFIDLLRNAMVIKQMGATVLSDLVGDVAIPRQSGGATAYWVAESGTLTESDQTFDQVTLSPNSVGAMTDISRRLLLQSSVGVESLVKADLAIVTAIAIDLAAINGSGAGNQPTGLLNTSGIGDVDYVDAWNTVIDLETDVDVVNALMGSLSYLTNATVKGALKKTFTNTTYGEIPIWGKGRGVGIGELNEYDAYVSNQVPADLTNSTGTSGVEYNALIFGNWRDLIIGEWSGIDVLVDPYTQGNAGNVRIIVFSDVDIGVRHAESFSACQNFPG